ncbi:UPF0182 family protein [Thermoproteota archaeon]
MSFDESERPPVPQEIPRKFIWSILIVVSIFLIWVAGGQLIWFWLNFEEFGELFIRPFLYEILGGLILASLALVRIDFKNRRSITWWLIRLGVRILRTKEEIMTVPPEYLEFTYFKLPKVKFFLWQITKIIIGMTIFSNIIFGMSIQAMFNGWESNIMNIPNMFSLPFVTPSLSMTYAEQIVIPLAPALTLLLSPILTVLGVRLIVLVGLTQIVKVVTSVFIQSTEPGQPLNIPLATIESLISIALLWAGVNLFFPSYIDYNTKFIIVGVFSAGILFAVFAYLDRSKRKRIIPRSSRSIIFRIATILIISLMVGSAFTIQNSIADARKVEWIGPYTTQEISVNRYLAQIDDIIEIKYNFSESALPPNRINQYVTNQSNLLSKVRLWDWDAAFAKLKPEIGLIPYVDFEDSDILRFNNTLYWSASLKPVLPGTIEEGNMWFNEHMVYTHVPNGFLILEGTEGRIVDSSDFFTQREIYYGEGGLLANTWSAYPLGSGRSAEVPGDAFYNGNGGVDMPPPISWIFDSTFLVSFPTDTIHSLRYRDVYDRMELLFPYFLYDFGGTQVDMYPVTDGEKSYWLMPLIVGLDGENIPWSQGNPLLRHVGYSLIDIYDGSIQLYITGNDFFSELFKTSYSDYIETDIPSWLRSQTRYPEELFEWRISMFNNYHVTDPATFITANQFYEVPKDLDTYFVISKPPLFEEPEFVGVLSLQLKGSPGKNLAGYVIVKNDYPNLGEVIFYKVSFESDTRLLGPTAVVEALQKDEAYAQRKTLLSSAGGVREGDKILYRVGDHDVYFIPVYTAQAGGVITQLGLVAAVGATFTGESFIGLGTTPEEAFTQYLIKMSGTTADQEEEIDTFDRRKHIETLFLEENLEIVEPTEIHPDIIFLEGVSTYISQSQLVETESLVLSLIEKWGDVASGNRIITWHNDDLVNYGILVNMQGVVELHYISLIFE